MFRCKREGASRASKPLLFGFEPSEREQVGPRNLCSVVSRRARGSKSGLETFALWFRGEREEASRASKPFLFGFKASEREQVGPRNLCSLVSRQARGSKSGLETFALWF